MQSTSICILSTGGTICSKDQGRGLAPQPLDKKVKNYLQKKYSSVNLDFEEGLDLIDSANMKPKYWAKLANYVQDLRTMYTAVIIFHGTDTMAFTAAALFLLLQAIDIPVVFVGSQKPIYSKFTDAYNNIDTAMLMAMSKYPGVFIAFNGKILPGMACSKIDSEKYDAFAPINTEVVARNIKRKLVFSKKYRKLPNLPPYKDRIFTGNEFNSSFHCFDLNPGADNHIMELASMFNILVIRSYGAGGLPEDILDELAKAQKKYNTKIGIATQCTYGGVNLNIYETGKTTKEKINLISAKKDALEYFTLKLRYKYNEENQNCFN
mgnify:CR=1 FL=1